MSSTILSSLTRVLCLLLAGLGFAATPSESIKLDQVGYLSNSLKVAVVATSTPSDEFTVRSANDGSVVFRGKLQPPVDDPDSGDCVRAADFTSLNKTGRYFLEVSGAGRSWEFAIGPAVYSRAWYLAMRSYYGQRCATAVDLGPEFPGYRHEACHLDSAYHPSSGKTGPRSSKGGWHDAGDYGRYIVNSGISTGTLLWTWEMFGRKIKAVNLHIPESGNGTPDILNEVRWNLEWMFSMQDDDGGVWAKQASERFCDFVMPEKDRFISYVIGSGAEPYKTSCATADFAAVMAIAARVYKPFDSAFASVCLRSAESAWRWLEKFPNVKFRNPAGVSTGEYGDTQCGDERLWAAAELARTTHTEKYDEYFLSHAADSRKSIRATEPQSWSDVANMALWTYALGGRGDPKVIAAIRQDSVAAADQIVQRTASNGYRTSLTSHDYIWGSNAVAANYAMQLVITNSLQPDSRYVDTALDNLHYLLGRNTFSLSFVTQVGANPVRHPHHRPSGADNNAEPWPGLLSGGPNRGRQDPAMRGLPADLPPAKMFLDAQEAYSANEVAINWNAPLVFVLSAALPE